MSNGAVGDIGQTCQSSNDCTTPYECLPVAADGVCTVPAPKTYTCQRLCTGDSDCGVVGVGYTCVPSSGCTLGMNGGICVLMQ